MPALAFAEAATAVAAMVVIIAIAVVTVVCSIVATIVAMANRPAAARPMTVVALSTVTVADVLADVLTVTAVPVQ